MTCGGTKITTLPDARFWHSGFSQGAYLAKILSVWHPYQLELKGILAAMTNGEQAAYVHYRAIVQSCYCRKCKSYKDVGARGIGMSKPWRQKFENFLKDMGIPEPGHTIVRINPNGPFNRDNCQWG